MDRKIFALLNNPEKLALYLSLLGIKKRYAKGILRLALQTGYRLPREKQRAEPLRKIRKWL
jgi:hypothetical protein